MFYRDENGRLYFRYFDDDGEFFSWECVECEKCGRPISKWRAELVSSGKVYCPKCLSEKQPD